MGLIHPSSVAGSGIIRPASAQILDRLTPAIGVWSLRKLRASYTGAAIRVRRSNDNAQADIGFDASGNLDTTALLAHTGANSGFVSSWYDQSGNSFDAVQVTTSSQPRIVNAGSTHTQNSVPAVNFNGTSQHLPLSGSALSMAKNVAGFSGFIVAQSTNNSANQSPFCLHGGTSTTNGRFAFSKNTSNRIQAVAKALDADNGIFASNATDGATLTSWINTVDYTAPNCILYKGGTSQGNATTTSTPGNTSNTDSVAIYIGCRGTGLTPNVYWVGYISELVLFPLLVDANTRAALYSSQSTYYTV
jgi:hypothetical protein